MIKWDATEKDNDLIFDIAKRAVALYKEIGQKVDIVSVEMDIKATHLNGCELRLKEFLEAKGFDFMHDITGINRHLNRDTGKLQNHFLPRFAKPCNKKGKH